MKQRDVIEENQPENSEAKRNVRLTRKPEEVGQILGIGRNGVYDLLREKKLRSINVGRKILIPLSAIEEFLAGQVD